MEAYIDIEWIMKNILKYSDSDIREHKRKIREDKLKRILGL